MADQPPVKKTVERDEQKDSRTKADITLLLAQTIERVSKKVKK